MRQALAYMLLVLLTASCVNNKEAPEPPMRPTPRLYPLEITRTASYTQDTTVSRFTYSQEKIIREDIYVNGKLNGYLEYSYNPAGKQIKKVVYNAAGTALEQDEIDYNIMNQPARMVHSHIEASGNPNVHHYRYYNFDHHSRLSEFSDLTPLFEPYYKIVYTYQSAIALKITEYGLNGAFLNQAEIVSDGRQNPFFAAGLDVVHFPGNEVSRTYQDQSGAVTYSVKSTIMYNAEGYPLRIVQNHSNGIVKTETYTYRQ